MHCESVEKSIQMRDNSCHYCLIETSTLQRLLSLFFICFLDATLLPGPLISLPSSPLDCVEAYHVCSTEPQCEALYRGLELCAADAAISPLGEQAAAECLERQDVLLSKHPALLSCKCQRGFRREEICLRIYWRVRLLPGKWDAFLSWKETLDSGQDWSKVSNP